MKSKIPLLLAAAFLSIICLPRAGAMERGTEEKPQKHPLKPGEYVWDPRASAKGPLVIIVNLGTQKLDVYRDGVSVGRSTISSGKASTPTPAGLSSILRKYVVHHSTAYHEASMPYSERLTWKGLAIHGGGLPGYPESHGCIHVPLNFARKLYSVTKTGETVLVTKTQAVPATDADPGLLLAGDSGQAAPDSASNPGASPAANPGQPAPGPTPDAGASPAANPGEAAPPPGPPPFAWNPQAAPPGTVSIIFSSADRKVYVSRQGIEIGCAPISGPAAGTPYGNYAYSALTGTNPDGTHRWLALGSDNGGPAPNISQLAKGLSVPPGFAAQVRPLITPGATLVVTDHPVKSTTKDGVTRVTVDL
jgi:hypothetical protein